MRDITQGKPKLSFPQGSERRKHTWSCLHLGRFTERSFRTENCNTISERNGRFVINRNHKDWLATDNVGSFYQKQINDARWLWQRSRREVDEERNIYQNEPRRKNEAERKICCETCRKLLVCFDAVFFSGSVALHSLFGFVWQNAFY